MADPPLQSVMSNWSRRSSALEQAGIPLKQYRELALRDVENVKRGGVAYSDKEAALAIRAGGGTPTINVERGTRIQDIPGNIPKNIEDIVRGFIPGAIKTIGSLPSDIASFVSDPGRRDERYGYEEETDVGAKSRNIARTPLVNFLPGSFIAQNVSTPEGREELAKNPVMALLDVLPFGSKLGRSTTAGVVAKPGGAVEALQQGRPVRAAFRATVDTAGRIPAVGKPLRRAEWDRMASQLGVSAPIRETLSRPFSQTQRIAEKEAKSFIDREIMPVFSKMTEEQRVAYTEYAIKRKTGEVPPNPEYDAINNQVNMIQERLANVSEDAGGIKGIYLPGVERPVYYSADSPVVRAQGAVVRSEAFEGKVADRLENARAVQEKWHANLTTREGKVRHFMESEEDFAARPIGAVGPGVLREAMRPFVESFQHLDPEKVFSEYLTKIMDGKVRAQSAGFLRRDFNKLKGESGLIAKMDEALAADDVKAAAKYATEIARVLRHKAWDGFDTTTRIRRHIKDVREELVGLRKRTKSFGYANRMAAKADTRVKNYEDRYNTAVERTKARKELYMDQLVNNPPRNFNPMIIDLVRNRSMEAAREMYHGAELDQAIQRIQHSPLMAELEQLIGKEKFSEIWDGTVHTWLDLAREGYDPIWLHHVPPSRFERVLNPRILPDQEIKPGQWRDAVLNFGPGVMDAAVGLSAAAAELIARKHTHHFIENYVMSWAKEKRVVNDEVTKAVIEEARLRPSFGVGGEVDRIMSKEWVDFDPADFGMRMQRATKEPLMVPKGVARALKSMSGGFGAERTIPLRGVYDKTMKVFKFSVLLGPKQFSDVVFGGMLTMLLREPRSLMKMPAAIRMWKAGNLPEEFIHEFFDLNPDKIWNFKAGQTMGRHFIESVGNAPRAIARMEEIVSAWERTAVYLSASERAARGGLSPALAREAGLRSAYKTLVDFDGMTWVERTIIRNVFPFYSFMKYTMQYALTYPTDHPVRAAILSRFADLEMKDQRDGLAEKYQNYFRLGQPDANGNVKIVDYRSANPFQSMANMFTLGGFTSAVNPIAAGIFEAAGLNMLTATPDLYPDMAYDPETGSMTAKRSKNPLYAVASSIVPQVEGVDYFLTITDNMKRLKERNPEAYKRQLYTHLHLPFAGLEGAVGAPGLEVNLPYERSKAEIGRFRAAREELSTARRQGDFSAVNRYNLVPFQGELVDPQQVEDLWSLINSRLAGTSLEGANPGAVMPRG